MYWQQPEFNNICASSAHEMVPYQESTTVKDKLFRFEQTTVALQKYRKYDHHSAEDATIMTIVRFDVLITGAIDSLKVHTDIQGIHAGQTVRGHEIEVDRSLRRQQK